MYVLSVDGAECRILIVAFDKNYIYKGIND